jgi:S1-C subfamily serine protease
VDVLDLLIIVAVVFFAALGYERGLSWVGFSLAGLLAGLVTGSTVAGPVARGLSPHNANNQSLIGTAVFLVLVLGIQGIGTAVGQSVRRATLQSQHPRVLSFDAQAGAGVGALGVLAALWYVAIVFSNSAWGALADQIQGSGIERALSTVAPKPPSFLTSVSQLISGNAFPNPFSGLVHSALPHIDAPPDLPAAARGVQRVTGLVLAQSCNLEEGTGWPVAVGYMVTNAHVVAGANQVSVQMPTDPAGHTLNATVVYFDPRVDVALLHVPSLLVPGLPLAPDEPSQGTTGAVVGYPGGATEEADPAAVRGVLTAVGGDIYRQSDDVQRQIEVLAAKIIPGNSGGPVIDDSGRVIGMVFAASTRDKTEGYALTLRELAPAIALARSHSTNPVSTQDCAG